MVEKVGSLESGTLKSSFWVSSSSAGTTDNCQVVGRIPAQEADGLGFIPVPQLAVWKLQHLLELSHPLFPHYRIETL